MTSTNSDNTRQRRKLSTDSLLVHFTELENLKQKFDLNYFSKGDTHIHKEFNKLKTKIEATFQQKVDNLSQNSSENTKLIENLNENKNQILNFIQEKKKYLANNLNSLKLGFDSKLDQIKFEFSKLDLTINKSNELNVELRDQCVELKIRLKNNLSHFSNLNDFCLKFYPSLDNPSKVGDLDIFPDKSYSSEEIFKRISSKNPVELKTIKLPELDNELFLLQKMLPLPNHQVLFQNSKNFDISIHNSDGLLRHKIDLLELNQENKDLSNVLWVEYAFNENFIFLLIQSSSLTLYLQSFDYELKLIKTLKLNTPNKGRETLKFTCVNSELFILRNYYNLSETEPVVYEIYDENLENLQELSPKSLMIEKSLKTLTDEPEVIGATKETVLIALRIKTLPQNRFVKSIRLINRDTGLEISRLDNVLFNSCAHMFITDEAEPKLVGLDILSKTHDEANHSLSGCRLFVFSLSNGMKLSESRFNFETELVHGPKKVRLTTDGYFGFTSVKNDTCYFF